MYNTFGETHTIRLAVYQVAGSLYTIAVWYEEVKNNARTKKIKDNRTKHIKSPVRKQKVARGRLITGSQQAVFLIMNGYTTFSNTA